MSKKSGLCALCRTHSKLVNSHIIPQLLHEHVFSDNDRIVGISTQSDAYIQIYQTGIFEPLLCEKCDNIRLGNLEKYFKRNVLAPHDHVTNLKNGRLVIRNLSYEKIKLFQLSLLWRMSVTTRHEFANVKLKEADEEEIRLRLLNEDPGPPHHYACFLVTNSRFVEMMTKTFFAPINQRTNGKEVIMMMSGPFFWNFFLSKMPPRSIKQNIAYITKDGTLPFFIENKISSRYLLETWQELRASGNVDRGLGILKK